MSSHILKEVTGPMWRWHLALGLLGGVRDLLIHFCGYLKQCYSLGVHVFAALAAADNLGSFEVSHRHFVKTSLHIYHTTLSEGLLCQVDIINHHFYWEDSAEFIRIQ